MEDFSSVNVIECKSQI